MEAASWHLGAANKLNVEDCSRGSTVPRVELEVARAERVVVGTDTSMIDAFLFAKLVCHG